MGGHAAAARAHDARTGEVWASLAPVTDPELDESVTELGFVAAVAVEGADVTVRFRLPTYWCAANFAYLMASDMHRAVSALPWVGGVAVELEEHMYAETINRGLAAGRSFGASFGEEADGELDAVRATFRRKAFQQRQESLLRHLLEQGRTAATLCALRVDGLEALADEAGVDRRLLARYVEIRREHGGPSTPDAFAFVDVDGGPLSPERFTAHLSALRRVRINTQFNGELCRGLLRARYGDDTAGPEPVHEVRVDFPRTTRTP